MLNYRVVVFFPPGPSPLDSDYGPPNRDNGFNPNIGNASVADPTAAQPVDRISSMDPDLPQDRYEYRWVTFGSCDGKELDKQIFLVTEDWLNYDAVDTDSGALHEVRGYSVPSLAQAFNPQFRDRFPAPLHGITPEGVGWWGTGNNHWEDQVIDGNGMPPCRQARHNYIPDDTEVDENGEVYELHLDEEPRGVHGRVAWRMPEIRQDVTITQSVLQRFIAGIDIPGNGWAGPLMEDVRWWTRHYEMNEQSLPAESWQWRFGRDVPMEDENTQRRKRTRTRDKGGLQLDNTLIRFVGRDLAFKCGAVNYL